VKSFLLAFLLIACVWVVYVVTVISVTPNSPLALRSLTITGASESLRAQIRTALPVHKSFVWWHLSQWKVLQSAQKFSEVASVRLHGTLSQPRSFTLEVEERRPRFVFPVGKMAALYSRDGTFMKMVDLDTLSHEAEVRNLILISFSQQDYSPDLIRSQARYLGEVASIVESKSPLLLTSLTLKDASIAARFAGIPFEVIFGKSSTDDFSGLARQTVRLHEIRSRLGEKSQLIRGMDVSYPPNVYVRMDHSTQNEISQSEYFKK
jgi:hypothetical protein